MDVVDNLIKNKLIAIESCRYRWRNKYRTREFDFFRRDADYRNFVQDSQPHLNEAEYRRKYRMSRKNVNKLTNLIKTHPVFYQRRGRKQSSVKMQLMTLLSVLGQEESSGARTRDMFGTGYGTHYNYCSRVVEAICSLREKVVYWPDEEERQQIAARMESKYDWPNCVGMGDGTLLPLSRCPTTEDAPDYSGRKFKYSLTCFIINDDHRRIRAYQAGWPGSVHDNRVFGGMRVNRVPGEYFSHSQYMLSDSALENCNHVVSAYKKPHLQPMPTENERFNTKLAKPRILSEHTIGILKGRFRWLKCIRYRVDPDEKSLLRILRVIDCCVILHNLMISNDSISDEEERWVEEEYFTDIDDSTRAPSAYDMLNRPVPPGSTKDERRKRLHAYFQGKDYQT